LAMFPKKKKKAIREDCPIQSPKATLQQWSPMNITESKQILLAS